MTLHAFVFKNRGLLLVPAALALVIFGKPTFASAVAGVIVAALGEGLRIWAVGYSGVTTRANTVTAPHLVTAGPYAFVRNPLYVGNGIVGLGFWLAFAGGVPVWLAVVLLVVVLVLVGAVYAIIVPFEEQFLLSAFGDDYARYLQAVPRVFPTRAPLPTGERFGHWHPEVIARGEVITLAFFVLMVAAVAVKLRL